MRNVKWLVATGLLVGASGCVEMDGYPTTGYGGGYPRSSYYGADTGYSGGYYNQPTYYQPAPVYVPVAAPPRVLTQTRYVPVPTASSRSSWGRRDDDGDGIPNRYDRDRNNDGVPDRLQRRG